MRSQTDHQSRRSNGSGDVRLRSARALWSHPVLASEPVATKDLEEERRLVEEAQKGNLDAMRPIFQAYAQPLFSSVILPRLGNRAAAEDVLKDTFTTAIEKLDKFTWTGKSIFVWLRQIAINKVYDVHRKTKRTQKLTEAVGRESEHATGSESRADSLLIAAEQQELNRERIAETLAAIPERYRTAIELRLIRELPRAECAAELDITVPTFDVLLYRAVRSFRKKFGSRKQ